jgi:heat shock protein HslJ
VRWQGGWLGLLAALACAGSAQAQTGPAALAGTHWQLLRFVSMDDAQPPQRPAAGAVYEIRFGLDGQVALRLDCNRAQGRYEADRAPAEATSGALRFGPLAATRAACGPKSLAPLLLRQLPYVRGWIVRDGRLHMSLMADGGILDWQPLPAPR